MKTKTELLRELNTRKRRLLKVLGPAYNCRIIDYEPCLYRNYGRYDVEISGGSWCRPFHIYVWKTRGGLECVARYTHRSDDLPGMKMLLDMLVDRYAAAKQEGKYEPL